MAGAVILQFVPMARSAIGAEPLPNRVREWREKRELTLKALAPLVGIHHTHLGKIETGVRELTKPVMERLAAALEVAAADLLNTEEGGLTARERYIIDTYRQVPEQMRVAIDAVAESQQPFRGFSEVADLPLRRPA
jgi:transcriptional regulator with XRE-family HTH domain